MDSKSKNTPAGTKRTQAVYKKKRFTRTAVSLISLLLVVGTLVPAVARASVLGDIYSAIVTSIKLNTAQADIVSGSGNVQTMVLLKPAMNIEPVLAKGGGDIKIVDDSALDPDDGPSGTPAEYEKPKNSTISVYVVREGDTLSNIAKLFKVSPNTILWANDLSSASKIKVGQVLTILPVTGVKYTVKKGDTLASIAKRYSGDATEIANFNGLDGATLAVGDQIIIPDGEILAPKPAQSTGKTVTASVKFGSAAQIGYYMAPISRYIETQGIHGYNSVDLGAPSGTPIMASAAGNVIVAKSGGYNGGYGSYVVIQHENGSQTLYAHMSKVSTYGGATVQRGEVIGQVGSTGRSTGAHLHFEIRNGIKNPF